MWKSGQFPETEHMKIAEKDKIRRATIGVTDGH